MAVKVKNSLENTALELFGLDASRVQNISTSPGIGQMLVEVTLVPAFPECPRCGGHNIVVFNYTPRVIWSYVKKTDTDFRESADTANSTKDFLRFLP